MTHRVVLAHDWPQEKVEPYFPKIIEALKLLETERPDDLTVQSLAQHIVNRTRTFWMVLDENDEFVSFFMTGVEFVPATGKTIGKMMDMAGTGGIEDAQLIADATIPWGKERGATIVDIEGRDGWWPALKKLGFRRHAVLYRKEV